MGGIAPKHGLGCGGREHRTRQNESEDGRAEVALAAMWKAKGDRHGKARRETPERPLTLQSLIVSQLSLAAYAIITGTTSDGSHLHDLG